MSLQSNDELLDLVNDTMVWANEVSEMWTGTMYEKMIDRKKEVINKTLKENDLERVRALVYDLAQFLDNAEDEYKKSEY